MEEEKKNKKSFKWVIITILIIILVGTLCAFGGYKYAESKNTKQDCKNSEKKDDSKDENPLPSKEKESWSINIKEECGDGDCHKDYEKVVNGVKYSISVDIEDGLEPETGVTDISKAHSTVKINDLTEEFAEIESVSEIGILENGLIAIRTIPVYSGNFITKYYKSNKLVERISSHVLSDYPITQSFGNYDECELLNSNEEGYDPESDNNQRLILYSFKINDDKTFSKTEIGRIEKTFCTAQS